MPRPLVHVALLLIAGQVAATALNPPLWSLFAGLGLLILAEGWLILRRARPGQPERARGALILAAFAMIGLTRQEMLEQEDAAADLTLESLERGGPAVATGLVEGAAEDRADAIVLTVGSLTVEQRGRAIALPGRIRLALTGQALETFTGHPPQAGQVVRATGFVGRPEPPTNPDLMDYGSFLRSHGFLTSLTCSSTESVEISDPPGGIGPWDRFQRGMAGFRASGVRLFQRVMGAEEAALLRSMLLGEASALDRQTQHEFARSGLAHLYSVSGLHTALVALVVFGLLRLAGAPWKVAWTATALLVWGFALLVGFRAPVVRSAIMASIFALSNVIGRPSDALNTLAVAALATLLDDSRALWRTDFQLSYMCVFAIVTLAPAFENLAGIRFDHLTPRRRRWMMRFHSIVARPFLISAAIQISLAPFLAYYFHQVSLAAVFTNVLVLPLGSVSVVVGFLLLLFGHLNDGLAAALGWLCAVDLKIFRVLLHGFGEARWAAFPVGPLPWWAAGAYGMVLLSGAYLRRADAPGKHEAARARLWVHGAALLALLVWLPLGAERARELMVRVLDVGQGDSIYIEFPSGQNLLIDGGPLRAANAGARVASLYLNAHGVKRLSAIVATHADADHIGGLPAVLRAIPADLVLHGPSESDSAAYRGLLAAARGSGALWADLRRGDRIGGIPGATIVALNPPR
ncbi:MAG: ComEC/Rec2 family competence protein, partial [Candidatus Sumerlaeota bacterium]|nr:ComEC/Rec2 family competence protein [Candidatus Sumerlaeota bacterium]